MNILALFSKINCKVDLLPFSTAMLLKSYCISVAIQVLIVCFHINFRFTKFEANRSLVSATCLQVIQKSEILAL